MPIHPLWIVALLVIVLIIFGPGRLPELGSAAGKAMREFRKATSELTNEVSSSVSTASSTPPATNGTTDSAAKSTESASSTKN
ncbi:MAG TPA: twin-arginine translocase TatA/TatE family subunit [Verrucomicrobiae bacterium]|jgi:sec-independent protein translocase protein TatA|nr:twin-arginine translocase TatA/TatE family subunit [Verrucomicrobiae bacterium]